jgi:transforming growth factor-beta-induced protein
MDINMLNHRQCSFSLSFALMALFLPALAAAQNPATTNQNASLSPSTAAVLAAPANSVMQVISTQPEFSKFNVAIKLANLDTLLSYASPLTVFAPSNEAFDKLTPQQIFELYNPQNLPHLQEIVKSHIVLQQLLPSSFNHLTVKSFQGTAFQINTSATGLFINEKVKVSLPPLSGSNGLIYMIDTVLFPHS